MNVMGLRDSTQLLRKTPHEDLEAVRESLSLRGRSVVEFAALASLDDLQEAQQAGQQLIEHLLEERRRVFAEFARTRNLHDTLAVTDCMRLDPNSFLG